ncbi:MAG: hypothetical protein AAGK74_18520 [Chloroflexota bacterium]
MAKRVYPPMRFSVPTGWAVLKNAWTDISPEEAAEEFHIYHTEDLLWICNAGYVAGEGYQVIDSAYNVDLGWYPDGHPKGMFRLVLYWDDWDNVVKEFKSRDRFKVRDKLEKWLVKYADRHPPK